MNLLKFNSETMPCFFKTVFYYLGNIHPYICKLKLLIKFIINYYLHFRKLLHENECIIVDYEKKRIYPIHETYKIGITCNNGYIFYSKIGSHRQSNKAYHIWNLWIQTWKLMLDVSNDFSIIMISTSNQIGIFHICALRSKNVQAFEIQILTKIIERIHHTKCRWVHHFW